MTSTDVLIVGGGPAGTAAAITLARAGRRVTLIDKAEFPRDKCCGDGLTTLALREVEALGLTPAQVPNWQTVRDVVLRAPGGREVRLHLPDGSTFAATTPRRELDTALVHLAVAAGAAVYPGCALSAIRPTNVDVQVDIDGIGTLTASTVVAADGMWSPTRKLLGLNEPGYLGEWHAMRQYASVGGRAATEMFVWFEADLLPGYAWSFPLPDGRANIGFGVLRDGRRTTGELGERWRELLGRPHIAAALGDVVPENRVTAWPIPAAIDRAVLASGRVLFAGDAARATDVMTGEGIGQALLTGRLAAEAVITGGTDAAAVAAHYTRCVRDDLFADHLMSARLGRLLARPRATDAALRIVDATAWSRRNFARWMFEDEPRAIVLTPRRWHRAMLRRPGAYGGRAVPSTG